MGRITSLLRINKRQKFVIATLLLSIGIFSSNFFIGFYHLYAGMTLAVITAILFFFILRHDLKGTFFYPLFILPFLYTLAFTFFYLLVPARIISMILLTGLYAFGIYSLFLTQNIFAVSANKTINLLRSARIVSFVITLLVLFFLINFVFSAHLNIFVSSLIISVLAFFLNFQSLWVYSQEKSMIKEISLYSVVIGLAVFQLSLILFIWPVTAAVYSLFLTGIFYTYSGLSHAWFEKRLFKGVLWEYIWVGFLSVLVLIIFSKWGI